MTDRKQTVTCSSEQLVLFQFGELAEAERHLVEAHLTQCRVCRDELASLRNLIGQIPTSVPELTNRELADFSSRVMDGLPHRSWAKPVLGWTLAGAVVLLLSLNLRPQMESLAPEPPGELAPMTAEQEVLNRFELLKDLDLLENLELLQQLESLG